MCKYLEHRSAFRTLPTTCLSSSFQNRFFSMAEMCPLATCTSELYHLYPSAQAAVTKYPRLGGFNNRNFLSYSSGGEKFKIRVPASSVPGESRLPDLQMLPSCYILTSLYLRGMERELMPRLLIRTRIYWVKEGPILMASFNLNYFYIRTPPPNTVTGRVRASTYEF